MTSTTQEGTFISFDLGEKMRLLVAPTAKFKRTRVMVVIHDQLDRERVSLGALLPFVQKRGTQAHPTGLDLERAAGRLYDAHVTGGVYKMGDRQLVAYALDIAADKAVGTRILQPGIELLADTVLRPLVEGDGFKSQYVDQEKQFQIGRIKALVNNKIALARHRCIEAMFETSPFALHELGTEESIHAVDGASLLSHHRELLAHRPLDIYVVGDVDPEEVRKVVQNTFSVSREEVVVPLVTKVERGSGEPKHVVQQEPMNQGWLVLGLKTNIPRTDPDRYGMMFFNGILGGFVHSKLFTNVREKASLAYSASSGYDANKGVLLAMAGIDVNKYDDALSIIQKQLDDTVAGRFTDEELEATRRGLRTRYRMRSDTAEGSILFHLGSTVEGQTETVDDALRAVESIGRDDVKRVGERLRLDTVYFLKGSGMNSG